jgi:putative transcriptional regulator
LALVPDGRFTDAASRHLRGDVEDADSVVDHRPVAERRRDRVCLAAADAPQRRTGALGRQLNPSLRR